MKLSALPKDKRIEICNMLRADPDLADRLTYGDISYEKGYTQAAVVGDWFEEHGMELECLCFRLYVRMEHAKCRWSWRWIRTVGDNDFVFMASPYALCYSVSMLPPAYSAPETFRRARFSTGLDLTWSQREWDFIFKPEDGLRKHVKELRAARKQFLLFTRGLYASKANVNWSKPTPVGFKLARTRSV